VLELLAERGIDVSHRTILDWVQVFGPHLAGEVRRCRRPVGKRWFVDEVFLFRKNQKRYLYRAIDEDGVVVEVLLRERRDTASATAFFRQAIERSRGVASRSGDRSSPALLSRPWRSPALALSTFERGCTVHVVKRPRASSGVTCRCATDCGIVEV
jgi:hypothetical protein